MGCGLWATAVFLEDRNEGGSARRTLPSHACDYFDTILRSDAEIDMAPLAVATSPVIDTV